MCDEKKITEADIRQALLDRLARVVDKDAIEDVHALVDAYRRFCPVNPNGWSSTVTVR